MYFGNPSPRIAVGETLRHGLFVVVVDGRLGHTAALRFFVVLAGEVVDVLWLWLWCHCPLSSAFLRRIKWTLA